MANTTVVIKDANGTAQTLSAGQDAGNSSYKVPKHAMVDSTGTAQFLAAAALADGAAINPTTSTVGAVPLLHNGATLDRQRSNQNVEAIDAVGVDTSQDSGDLTNHNGNGLTVVLDMTTVGTGSVTLTIQGKDPYSGKYYTLLAGAAVTTNSTNVYRVFPAATVTANVSANAMVPRTYRLLVTANNANATTYKVGACLHC